MSHRSPDLRVTLVVLGLAVALVGAWEAVYLTTQSSAPAAPLSLSISRDPTTGDYRYVPGQVRLPFDVPVEITITNWDPVAHGSPGTYSNVTGTGDGMMAYMGRAMMGTSHGQFLASVPPAMVSHTFTFHSDGADVNVPIPAASDASTPTVVVFTVEVRSPGSWIWGCMASDMSGDGSAMMGTLVVS